MVGNDWVQLLVGASCIVCVAPIVILWAMLRLAAGLERLLLKHSLLLWLFPIALWLKANREEEDRWNQHNSGCYR